MQCPDLKVKLVVTNQVCYTSYSKDLKDPWIKIPIICLRKLISISFHGRGELNTGRYGQTQEWVQI